MKKVDVVLYGHRGCPGTVRAWRYLQKQEISFIYKDIAEPVANSEWMLTRAWATPLLVIGGETMVGFDDEEIERMLNRHKRWDANAQK